MIESFNSTRISRLTMMPTYYKKISNVHLKINQASDTKQIEFLHKLVSGPSDETKKEYGIYIAKVSPKTDYTLLSL